MDYLHTGHILIERSPLVALSPPGSERAGAISYYEWLTEVPLPGRPLDEAVVPDPLQALGGQCAALEITLAAGDAVLFKYATGAPFASQ